MPEVELDRDQLISLVVQLREEVRHAHDRIAELEQQLGKQSSDTRLKEEYSLKAEERRQNKQSGKRRKQNSERRGRRTTQEKLDAADRIQIVCPEGCVSRNGSGLSLPMNKRKSDERRELETLKPTWASPYSSGTLCSNLTNFQVRVCS